MVDSTDQDVLDALQGLGGVQQLLAALPEWVVLYDQTLTIRYVSNRPDAVERAGEGLGLSFRDFADPEHVDEYEALIRNVFDTGERTTFEVRARNIDGEFGWYVNTVSPLRSADGSISLVVMMTRDITDRKQAEEALERALDHEREAVAKLRELDQMKSGFVANVVHDLRTPITVIQGFARTLEDRWGEFDDDERRRFLTFISSGTDRLMRLVDDVMLVSRLESGELPLQRATFDLAELIRNVATELEHGTDAHFELRVPEHAPAHADELRIRQVLSNLFANALRYSPANLAVEVAVDPAADAGWRVSVIDAGPGIALEDQPRLFKRFSQLDPTAGGHGGSGLGLYICRSIVEAHGGEIGVRSTPGDGTTFWFTVEAAVASGHASE